MPEHIAEDMPGRMPEDMPDRIPEDMPDKVPEDMSDRMPEDLPVTKRIDVMVGITRSKAFFFKIWIYPICLKKHLIQIQPHQIPMFPGKPHNSCKVSHSPPSTQKDAENEFLPSIFP